MTTKVTHNEFVLNHLIDHGYITDAQAQGYRIRRLAARIFDITRRNRVLVHKETCRDDLGQKYTRYFLSDSERAIQRAIRKNRGNWPAIAA